MEGEVLWKQGRFDVSVLLTDGTRDFITLYDAKIMGILIPTLQIDAPAVIFNRKLVDLFGLINQRRDEE